MRALTALVLTLVALSPAAALATGPYGSRTEASAKEDLALALGVAPELVVSARAYDLPPGAKHPGFVLGRYRERPERPWTFPALGLYHRCKLGTCIASVHLGPAAEQLVPLAVVDLDAPTSALPIDRDPTWHLRDVPGPLRARWPALAIAVDRQQPPGGGPERLTSAIDLVVVSLRDGAKPVVLFEHDLHRRWADATEEEMRGPSPRPPGATVGARLEALRFERVGDERRIVLTSRPIDSRWNGCLRSRAHEAVFAYAPGPPPRYRELPSSEPPPLPCH